MMDTMDDEELRREYIRMFGSDPFRPRDEFDVDVHPDSFRGKALALMDEVDEAAAAVEAAIRAMPWYRRIPIRAYLRLRGIRLT